MLRRELEAPRDALDRRGALFTSDHVHEKTVQAELVGNK